MEMIDGGQVSAECAGTTLITAAGTALLVIGATNPIGWGLIGIGAAFGFGSGLLLGNSCMS